LIFFILSVIICRVCVIPARSVQAGVFHSSLFIQFLGIIFDL